LNILLDNLPVLLEHVVAEAQEHGLFPLAFSETLSRLFTVPHQEL